jgi:hypothetical protein
VHTEGHLHVQRCLPEGVVLRGRVALAAREDTQHGALEPQLANVLQLQQRVLQVGHGDDAQAQQAVRVRRAIVLSQETVVRTDAGFVRLVIANVPPEIRAGGLPREQHLSIDTINVLLLQPLLSRSGARCGRIVLAIGFPDVAPLAAVQIKGDLAQGLSLDGPCVTAVRQPHQSRRLVAVLFGYPVYPPLGIDLQVGVAGDVAIVPSHI